MIVSVYLCRVDERVGTGRWGMDVWLAYSGFELPLALSTDEAEVEPEAEVEAEEVDAERESAEALEADDVGYRLMICPSARRPITTSLAIHAPRGERPSSSLLPSKHGHGIAVLVSHSRMVYSQGALYV